jgi:ABC-type polysaccharide/polyol phosphate transport system ATPase subunit
MNEPLTALPIQLKRRIGIVVVLAADFDCLLIDHPMRASMFGLDGRAGQEFEEAILSHDYVASVTMPRHKPANCDLAYLLYDGRLYMFEDVDEAVHVYNTLPVPEAPGWIGSRGGDDDEDDAEFREEGF